MMGLVDTTGEPHGFHSELIVDDAGKVLFMSRLLFNTRTGKVRWQVSTLRKALDSSKLG